MAVTDLIKVQHGMEGVWGTLVAATRKVMGVTNATLSIVEPIHQTEKSTRLYPSQLAAQTAFSGEGTLEMDLTYEDILIPLDNFFDEDTPGGAGPYTWVYDAPTTTAVTPNLYSLEIGATSAEYLAAGVLFTELNISGEAASVWKGSFPFICADIDAGAMAVLADRTVQLIRMADTVFTVSTWAAGVWNAVADTLISFELSVQNGRHLKFFGGDLLPQAWGDTAWTGTLKTVCEFNASAKAYVDELLTPALVQRRLRLTATSGTNIVQIDFAGTLDNGTELFSDRDGNITVELNWLGTYNPTATNWLSVNITNDIPNF